MTRTASVLMWIGLIAAPVAWTVQHVAGVGVTQGICGVEAMPVPSRHLVVWTIGFTAVAAAFAVAGLIAAFVTWRRTRNAENALPAGRVHFLASVALTVTPLMLAIMLLSAISVLAQSGCRQS